MKILLLFFTSLLQALMSSSKKTAGTQNAQLTDGIDIKTWTVKSENGLDITFSAWDFAGQTVYYNTHQVRFYVGNSLYPSLSLSLSSSIPFSLSLLPFFFPLYQNIKL